MEVRSQVAPLFDTSDIDPGPMQRVVGRLSASVARVQRTICDLIDVRAIELGVLQVVRRPTNLQDLVEQLVRRFPLHERRRIGVEASAPLCVFADPTRLSRVLGGLVELALASSVPSASIVIRIERQQMRACVSVLVAGAFARQIVPMLAEVENPPARPHQSERLTLFVAHHTLDAHGGTLTAVELPSVGTRLCVELPLPMPAPVRRPVQFAAGASVLLVDDSADQLAALAALLRADGLAAQLASSGAEALAEVARHPPDVLVVDAQMPDMNGAEVIRRARLVAPELPAVVVTGYPPHHPSAAEAVEATRGAYVAKPVDVSTLYLELAKALQRPRTNRAIVARR